MTGRCDGPCGRDGVHLFQASWEVKTNPDAVVVSRQRWLCGPCFSELVAEGLRAPKKLDGQPREP